MNDLANQLAHCDGADCRCGAVYSGECVCDADWTPAEVYRLRDERDALRTDLAAMHALIACAPRGTIFATEGGDPDGDDYLIEGVQAGLENELAGKRVALVLLGDDE